MLITHRKFVRHATTIGRLSLLAFAAVGCATGGAPSPARPLRPPVSRPSLVVENAGNEPVRLYLAERGHQWLVGYVLPGRTEVLPLPAALGPTPAGREFTLVVVPSTAARSTRAASGMLPRVIASESFNVDYLASMRWRVVGRWVVAVPDPIWP